MLADSQLSGASWDIAAEAIQETDPRLKNQRGNAIPMKQIALSLFVIAASGAYVWDQAGKNSGDIMLDSALPAGAVEAHAVQPVAPPPAAAMPAIPAGPARRETRLTTRASTASEMASAISTPSESRVLPATPPAAVRAAPQPSPSPIKQTIVPAMIRPPAPTPSFVATPATYVPIPQPRPAYPDTAAPVVRVGMKLADPGLCRRRLHRPRRRCLLRDHPDSGPRPGRPARGAESAAISVRPPHLHPHQQAGAADAARRSDQRAKRQCRHHFGRDADQQGLHPVAWRRAEEGVVIDHARNAYFDGHAHHGRCRRARRTAS